MGLTVKEICTHHFLLVSSQADYWKSIAQLRGEEVRHMKQEDVEKDERPAIKALYELWTKSVEVQKRFEDQVAEGVVLDA